MATSSSLVLCIAVFALTPLGQEATTPQTTKPVAEKKLCRRVVPTGSVIPVKICLTKAEWKQVNDPNKDSLDRYARPGMVGCPPTDGGARTCN